MSVTNNYILEKLVEECFQSSVRDSIKTNLKQFYSQSYTSIKFLFNRFGLGLRTKDLSLVVRDRPVNVPWVKKEERT